MPDESKQATSAPKLDPKMVESYSKIILAAIAVLGFFWGAFQYLDAVQILEGDPADIEPVFERICCDFRDSKVSLLEFGPAERRHFGEWSMVSVDDVTAADPERLEDLLTSVSAGLPPSTIVRKVRSLLDGDA